MLLLNFSKPSYDGYELVLAIGRDGAGRTWLIGFIMMRGATSYTMVLVQCQFMDEQVGGLLIF